MIRRVALSALAITMSVSMLTGCNKKKDNSSATKVVEYDVMDYVTTLGVYTGLTETEEITNVTDDDVQAELDSLVSQHTTTTEVTDRPAQTGDTVKIEYTRTPDGAEGETKSDYSVTLGSGDLSEAVENNIMAMNIGETKTFALKENEDTTDETIILSGTFNDVYPSPKTGLLYLFRTKEIRYNFLYDNFKDTLRSKL